MTVMMLLISRKTWSVQLSAGGSGADSLYLDNGGSSVFVDAAASDDADTIHLASTATSSTITAGSGNDSILLSGGIAGSGSVVAGAGNDTIQATGTIVSALLSGEDGEDLIHP